jgi:hypothetical protein
MVPLFQSPALKIPSWIIQNMEDLNQPDLPFLIYIVNLITNTT